MKLVLTTLALILASDLSGLAQSDNEKGYMDCSLKNLVACRNSNQIVAGLHGSKPETARAIGKFLSGAPSYFVRAGSHTFVIKVEAAIIEAFWGPGDGRYHFADGSWFFDGFTPHAAPYSAAIIFGAEGDILLAAVHDRPGGNLRIYLHAELEKPEYLRHVEDWARGDSKANASVTVYALSKNGKHWKKSKLS